MTLKIILTIKNHCLFFGLGPRFFGESFVVFFFLVTFFTGDGSESSVSLPHSAWSKLKLFFSADP